MVPYEGGVFRKLVLVRINELEAITGVINSGILLKLVFVRLKEVEAAAAVINSGVVLKLVLVRIIESEAVAAAPEAGRRVVLRRRLPLGPHCRGTGRARLCPRREERALHPPGHGAVVKGLQKLLAGALARERKRRMGGTSAAGSS